MIRRLTQADTREVKKIIGKLPAIEIEFKKDGKSLR